MYDHSFYKSQFDISNYLKSFLVSKLVFEIILPKSKQNSKVYYYQIVEDFISFLGPNYNSAI